MFTILFSLLITIVIGFFLIGYFWPPKAGLLVISNPKAEVFIDGKKVGETPYDGILKPKEVVVKIVPFDSNISSYETKVKLTAKVKTILQRDLAGTEEKSSGIIISFERSIGESSAVSIISEPDNAQVIIDGQVRGFTPLQLSFLEPGEHNLYLSETDFVSKEINIRTYSGYNLTAFFKLAPVALQQDSNLQHNVLDEGRAFRIKIKDNMGSGVEIREKPYFSSKQVGLAKNDEEYEVYEETENKEWYKIGKDNKIFGWISQKDAIKI